MAREGMAATPATTPVAGGAPAGGDAAAPAGAAGVRADGTAAKPAKPARKRVLYFDALNIAACFAVIVMHFNGLVHTYAPTTAWAQALAAECASYWAVPVFFMLSGATLMGYRRRYDTRTFLKKRVLRTVVPFLAWSLIILVWKVATGQLEPPVGPRSLIDMIFNTKIIDIYWFFIPLFAVYLCMPVLSCLADGKHDRVLWYAAACAFITSSVLPCVFLLMGIPYNGSFMFPLLSGYLLFPVLGYLLNKTELTRGVRWGIYAAGAGGFLLRFVSTFVLSSPETGMYQVFWGPTNFPTVMLAVSVFVLFKQIPWERVFSTPARVRTLGVVAGASFGIYLTHMVFFYYAGALTGLDGSRLLWRTVMPFVAYVVCLVGTLVMKRIPGVRAIVP